MKPTKRMVYVNRGAGQEVNMTDEMVRQLVDTSRVPIQVVDIEEGSKCPTWLRRLGVLRRQRIS
jgi:hypothetical protein